jgi:site-specific recombinase XerC
MLLLPPTGATRGRDAASSRACGIDVTMHQLRHRAGTILYRTSKDLRMVQEFLGHRSVVTTQG